MKYKTLSASFKALDDGKGEFEAIVAIFGNIDLGGDRIVKGAFAGSLRKWASKGRPIPVVFSHMWGDLDAHIGEVIEARESDTGLVVKAQLDMEDPPAAKVWRLMKRGTLAEFSFAYDVIRERKAGGVNELLELDVIEVGPTLVGMNRETQLLAVKGHGLNHVVTNASAVACRAAFELMELGFNSQPDSVPRTPAALRAELAGLGDFGAKGPHPSVLSVRATLELLSLGFR